MTTLPDFTFPLSPNPTTLSHHPETLRQNTSQNTIQTMLTLSSLPAELHRLIAYHSLEDEGHVMNLAYVSDYWYEICDQVVADHYAAQGLQRLSLFRASRYQTHRELARFAKLRPEFVLRRKGRAVRFLV